MSCNTVAAITMKHDAKNELLLAARALFVAKGYSSVGTREIAEAAGVNLSLIKYHFGSKEQLFVESVRSLMEEAGGSIAERLSELSFETPEKAAAALGRLIASILASHLLSPTPQPCRVMFREVLSEDGDNQRMLEELVATVVKEYISPTEKLMRRVLKSLSENLSDAQVSNIIQSIIGQCSFYITHRPFIEKLRGADFSESSQFASILEHVVRFTLRGIDRDITPEMENFAVRGAFEQLDSYRSV